MRKTKIICTLGPSTDKDGVLRELIANGMNVARFNFSHGSHEEHKGRLDLLKSLREELGKPVAALLDTKGPEIRLKDFKNGTEMLEAGQTFTLTTRDVEGTKEICSITYKDLPKDLKPEDYKRYKNAIAEKYILDYEQLSGINIREHIEEISIATPVTFARYLGTPDGTIYGYKLSGWDNLLSRISCEKDEYTIPGLTFCGGHAFRGDGYSSAYVTGDTVGRRIVKKLKGDC